MLFSPEPNLVRLFQLSEPSYVKLLHLTLCVKLHHKMLPASFKDLFHKRLTCRSLS